MRRGSFHRLFAGGTLYAFGRRLDGERLIAAFNPGSEPQEAGIPLGAFGKGEYRPVFGAAEIQSRGDELHLKLSPRSSVVLYNRI